MNSPPLTVVALLRAKPGKEAVLREELLRLIPITRQEPGCLNYDLHAAVNTDGFYLFHENWASKQHLEDHLGRPHMAAFLAKANDLLLEPVQITLWEKVG